MTDKIIINGVDVNGCDYLTGADYCWCGHCNCNENSQFNCYYKQLKRKEETINQLEKIAEKYQTEFEKDALSLPTAIESIIERKEKELQAEKEKVKELEEENSNLKTVSVMINNNKYKQALEEINGIAGQINSTILNGQKSPKYEWIELYTMTTIRILQKCKVLDE